MSLTSTILVPELQYYFENFILNSTLNKYQILSPSSTPLSSFNTASFIQLLFDDSWPRTLNYYNYLFREITSKGAWPQSVLDRTGIYSQSAKYYLSDSASVATVNLFNLQPDDHGMLSRLKDYRLDTTGVTLIDINYSELSTNLAKMIFLYLDLMINSNYSNYNNLTLLSDSNSVLECFYEAYLIENMFTKISDRGT